MDLLVYLNFVLRLIKNSWKSLSLEKMKKKKEWLIWHYHYGILILYNKIIWVPCTISKVPSNFDQTTDVCEFNFSFLKTVFNYFPSFRTNSSFIKENQCYSISFKQSTDILILFWRKIWIIIGLDSHVSMLKKQLE